MLRAHVVGQRGENIAERRPEGGGDGQIGLDAV